MKKVILLVAAAILVCAPKSDAQVRVDAAGLKSKIAKSDEDIQNPKKNIKSSVWMDRGKLFYDVAEAPSAGIYSGIDETSANLLLGQPKNTEAVVVGENEYTKITYTNVIAYAVSEGGLVRIEFWEPTLVIVENALGKSLEAYMKAYDMDKGTAQKVTAAQASLGNSYKQQANNLFSLQKYTEAAGSFVNAYETQIAAPAQAIDTLALFNAGFLYTVALDFAKGEQYLKKSIEVGNDNDGDTYYYLYHCYYGQKNEQAAKDILMQGLAKYPENVRIVEGLLQLYTTGDNDPKEIVAVVQEAIDKNPTNAALYSGLGLIYDKLGDPEKSIEAFRKTTELMPNDFGSNFNLGLLLIKKADEKSDAFGEDVIFTDMAEFQKAKDELNNAYKLAIEPLEKALEINPTDPGTIELLRGLTFRLKDEPGMADKYAKYNAMFEALPAAQ